MDSGNVRVCAVFCLELVQMLWLEWIAEGGMDTGPRAHLTTGTRVLLCFSWWGAFTQMLIPFLFILFTHVWLFLPSFLHLFSG